mmetsp:Transcript_11968/g.27192  ORF Transcript_11968/g.27192 Transcript_11968/m.27192 type:complete len:97 (-) Transcript_11968:785-1075(-)
MATANNKTMAPRLLLSLLLLCVAVLPQPASAARHLTQWLRVPAYDTINPGQIGASLAGTAFDSVSYGSLDSFLGDFFDSSFELFQAGIADIGALFG